MKKLSYLLMMTSIACAMLFTSCKKDDINPEEDPNLNAEKIIGSWNLDAEDTYVIRLYTSAAGNSSADTVPLSSGGTSIVYTFGNNGILVQTTIGVDGKPIDKSYEYSVKGEELVFNSITHYIRTLDDADLAFEEVQDHDYASGEHLKYFIHYGFHKKTEE